MTAIKEAEAYQHVGFKAGDGDPQRKLGTLAVYFTNVPARCLTQSATRLITNTFWWRFISSLHSDPEVKEAWESEADRRAATLEDIPDAWAPCEKDFWAKTMLVFASVRHTARGGN